MMKCRALRMLTVAAFAWASCGAYAQNDWPIKPVRVIVPFAAGGNTDVVARLLTKRLSEEYGQPFVVDNRPGAGGMVGAEVAARAAADGYTVIVVASGYGSGAALYDLPYDPIKGIAPIGLIATGPMLVAVSASVTAPDMSALIQQIRATPNIFNYGSSGVGSLPHFAVEFLGQLAGTQMIHVPYKGDAPALTDLASDRIQVLMGAPMAMAPFIKSGRIRPLAVSTESRSPAMPNLPALGETVPGYAVTTWYGMWAPHGTPRSIVMKLNQSILRFGRLDDVQTRLRADGMEPSQTSPEQFGQFIETEIAKWKRVAKAGGIKPE